MVNQHSADDVDDLLSPMLGADFYLIRWRGNAETTADQLQQSLRAHLEWMIGLEKSGALLGSGPITEGESLRPGDGLTIVRADSAASATALARQDPFVNAGLRTFDVHRWRLMEGSLSVQLCFSDGSYQFS